MRAQQTGQAEGSSKHTLATIACLLAVTVGGLLFWRNTRAEKMKEDHKPFAAISALAAKETAGLLGGSGKLVTVSEKADPAEKVMAVHVAMIARKAENEVAAFKNALGKAYAFLPDEKLLRGAMTQNPVWPPATFQRLAAALPDGGALVSFATLPLLSAQDVELIRRRNLRIIVIGQRVANIEALLRDKTVALAVIFKQDMPPLPPGKIETPEEVVRRTIEVLR